MGNTTEVDSTRWDVLLYAIRETVCRGNDDPEHFWTELKGNDKFLFFSDYASDFYNSVEESLVNRSCGFALSDLESYSLYQMLGCPVSEERVNGFSGELVLVVPVKCENHTYSELSMGAENVYLFCRKLEDAQFVMEVKEMGIARYFIF